MKKRIFFIIVGALLILALIFLLWFWFFGRNNKDDVLPNSGSLGTSQSGNNTGANGGTNGNGQAPIGSNTNTGTNTGTSGGTSGGQGTTPTVSTPTYSATSTFTTPFGVIWLDGSSGIGGAGNNFGFIQTPINDINTGTVRGTPSISNTIKGADGKDISLASSLAVIIGGCLVSYAAQEAVIAPATTAISTGVSSAGNFLAGLFGFNVSGATPLNPLYTSDITEQGKTSTDTVTECLARTLGRLAVQQITQSTVEWINSGFNGQPAYVQDFGQFFTDVADKSAGEFIQGSGLAFLCSPFQLQVKIAIAQSYANRKSASAGSCSLTQVTGNIDNFLKGSFSDGGWPAFLQFTTVPANNPFAGYTEGQIRLGNAIAYDTENATLNISPGGFLSQTEQYDCQGVDTTTKKPYGCKTRVVTPGSAIEASLHTTFQGQLDSLQLGDSIDQIIGALTNQLITKVLYSGLASASKPSNQSNTGNQATSQATILMQEMQAGVAAAQQYAAIKQRSTIDIQTAQQNLATLANCWAQASSTRATTPDQVAQADSAFTNTVNTIKGLQTRVEQLNNTIVAANDSVANLQGMQTDLLLATVSSEVRNIQSQFNTFKAGVAPRFYTNADVTLATQDRQTLQSEMNGINQNTSAQLTQCYAFGQ